MASNTYPSVKAEIVRKPPTTVTDNGDAIGALIGVTQKGPVSKRTRVTSYTQAERVFGPKLLNSDFMFYVEGFFDNGGKILDIVSVKGSGYAESTVAVPNGSGTIIDLTAVGPGTHADGWRATTVRRSQVLSYLPDAASLGTGAITFIDLQNAGRVRKGQTFRIRSLNGGETDTLRSVVTAVNGNRVFFASTAPSGAITVASPSDAVFEVETFDLDVRDTTNTTITGGLHYGLEMNVNAARYYVKVLTDTPDCPVKMAPNVAGALAADLRPTDGTYTLAGGNNGSGGLDQTAVADAVFTAGLAVLRETTDFDLASVPGVKGASNAVTKALIDDAQSRRSYYAISEVPDNTSDNDAITYVTTGVNRYGMFAEGPWMTYVEVADPVTGGTRFVSPVGHRMGVIARCTRTRGWHKAPAGVNDGRISGVISVRREIGPESYQILYPAKINAIQSVPGGGLCFMGNNSLDGVNEFPETGLCLYFIHQTKVMERNTIWALFEENDEITRGAVTRQLTSYYRQQWRKRSLTGKTEREAFIVKCDEENNPPSVVRERELIIEVWLNPPSAAEFIHIKIARKLNSGTA